MSNAPLSTLNAPALCAMFLSATTVLLAATSPATAVTIIDRTMTVLVEYDGTGPLNSDIAMARRDPSGATSTVAQVGIGGSTFRGTYSAVGLVDASNGFYRVSGRTDTGRLRAQVTSVTSLANTENRTFGTVFEFGIAGGFIDIDAILGFGSWGLSVGTLEVDANGAPAGPVQTQWFSAGSLRNTNASDNPFETITETSVEGSDIQAVFRVPGPFSSVSFPFTLHSVPLPALAPGARLDVIASFGILIMPELPFEAFSSFGFVDPADIAGFPLDSFTFTPLGDGPSPAPIPLPASALPLVAALGALVAVARRRRSLAQG